jgi:hypothetical protein
MRNGLWPKNIFIDSDLFYFFHSLAPEHRNERNIVRSLLCRLGYFNEFYLDKTKEGFTNTFDKMMQSSHIQKTLQSMKKDSILLDLAIVDDKKLFPYFDKFISGNKGDWILQIYTAICIEFMLRSVVNARVTG